MLNQKKVEIFLVKIRKSLAKQFLEVALIKMLNLRYINTGVFNTENGLFPHFISSTCKYRKEIELLV